MAAAMCQALPRFYSDYIYKSNDFQHFLKTYVVTHDSQKMFVVLTNQNIKFTDFKMFLQQSKTSQSIIFF